MQTSHNYIKYSFQAKSDKPHLFFKMSYVIMSHTALIIPNRDLIRHHNAIVMSHTMFIIQCWIILRPVTDHIVTYPDIIIIIMPHCDRKCHILPFYCSILTDTLVAYTLQ